MPEPSPEAVEALFQEAADLDPAQRGSFLDERCAGDTDLRATLATADAVPASFGRYRVIRRLGEGGMGTVYEAEQDAPRRAVALKVMRPGLHSGDSRKRFV